MLDAERRAVLVGERTDRDKQVLDERREAHRLQAQIDFPRLDLREIEYVVDELEQVFRRFVRTLDALALLLVQRAVDILEQQRAVPEDGIDRRAQLVTHRGVETTARRHRSLEILLPLIELVI